MFSARVVDVNEAEAPILERMLEDAHGASAAQKYATFQTAVHAGSSTLIDVYFDIHSDCDHLEQDKIKIIDEMVREPSKLSKPLHTYQALTKHIDVNDGHFDKQSASFDQLVWRMYAAQPTDEVAQVGARLMAEFLRHKLLRDMQYAPDFSFLTSGENGGALWKEFKSVALKDSVKVIQNALVDYVSKEGPTLPLNRAAGMLPILAEDAKPQTSALWTQKISDFRITTGYSMQHGDVHKASPVFETLSL